MATVFVTYNAPEGDDILVEVFGLRFLDDEAVEIDADEHPYAVGKLRKNWHFVVSDEAPAAELDDEGNPIPKRRRGRPRKA